MFNDQNNFGMKQVAIILAIFALICLVTAFMFNMRGGKTEALYFKPSADGMVAPQRFEVPRDNQVYLVKFSQPATNRLRENQDWANADITIKTEDDQVITSFGGDFWRASGYDEGHWSEVKSRNEIKITIRHQGTYIVDVELSSSRRDYHSELVIKLIPKRASSLPFTVVGGCALLLAIAIGYFAQRQGEQLQSRRDGIFS